MGIEDMEGEGKGDISNSKIWVSAIIADMADDILHGGKYSRADGKPSSKMPLAQPSNILCNIGACILNSVTGLHKFVGVYWGVFGHQRQVVLKLVVVKCHPRRAARTLWSVLIFQMDCIVLAKDVTYW